MKLFDCIYPELFDFDSDKMMQEFNHLRELYPDSPSYTFTFVNEEDSGIMDNLWDVTHIRKRFPPDVIKQGVDAIMDWKCRRFGLSTFHSYAIGSYFHTVCLKLEEEYNKLGKRLSTISVHEIKPYSCLGMHHDYYPWGCRMHIPIQTNAHAYHVLESEIDNGDYEVWQMSELGRLYRLPCDVIHTAINAGHEGRVHLIFDLVDIDYIP